MFTWDDGRVLQLLSRYDELARKIGALSELAITVNMRAILLLVSGQASAAMVAVEEANASAEAFGDHFLPFGPMVVAAWRGAEGEATALIERARKDGAARGEGAVLAVASWAEAVLNNGLGRYEQALSAAQRAAQLTRQGEFGLANWVLTELIEAAARAGAAADNRDAWRELEEMSTVSGTDWVLGIDARARALLSDDETAEKLYQQAIDHLSATALKAELARTHLLLGEWLRRGGRRSDARVRLHEALDLFGAMGMEGFAERARRELRATGESARKRRADSPSDLTAQESQVARLAGEGLSNPEIAARLFISARTVQYHLGKVFSKLGISSRNQLDRVLDDRILD